MNTWEAAAYQHEHGGYADSQAALFYPGMYCRDDYNMLHILAQVNARPNPQIPLGPVDLSCPMVLCDLSLPDEPIVYANQAFSFMTGYTLDEIKGRNCRFLQAPDGNVSPKSKRPHIGKETIRHMRKSLDKRVESQVVVKNFKKGGIPFNNILTMVPITVSGRSLCIGFQCEQE